MIPQIVETCKNALHQNSLTQIALCPKPKIRGVRLTYAYYTAMTLRGDASDVSGMSVSRCNSC
eukprot:scaffold24066_cov10-Prasinocladus_malaysianus.AAC.1